MGKRRVDNLRSPSEVRLSSETHYYGYVKKPSKINPIFLRVPDYGTKKEG